MAEDIECMCQIMSTIGKRLDTSKAMNIMNQYFDRIEMLSQSSELPSRIRFMLKDVIELRNNNVCLEFEKTSISKTTFMLLFLKLEYCFFLS